MSTSTVVPGWRSWNADGEHLSVENAQLSQIPNPVPDIYFGGSSPAAGKVAAEHADVYLTWGEPPSIVRSVSVSACT